MDFYDYVINRNAAQKKNPGKLSSHRLAAELICLCWNRLDMSFVEPYLEEKWFGKAVYLTESLRTSKPRRS